MISGGERSKYIASHVARKRMGVVGALVSVKVITMVVVHTEAGDDMGELVVAERSRNTNVVLERLLGPAMELL
jgi:hypothetical protein